MTDLSLALRDEGPAFSRYAYRAPGAYVEFPRGRRTITPRRTDILGIVGLAERGPLDEAVRVESWPEFTSVFGTHIAGGYLAYAVEAFFANGGRTSWVVRVAGSDARAAELVLRSEGGSRVVTLTSGQPPLIDGRRRPDPGRWANAMTAAVERDGHRFSLIIRDRSGRHETWRNLVMDGTDGESGGRPIISTLNDVETGSQLVTAEQHTDRPPRPTGPQYFSAGHDDLAGVTVQSLLGAVRPASATEPALVTGLRLLEDIDEIAILAVPDLQEKPLTVPAISPLPVDCGPAGCGKPFDPCAEPSTPTPEVPDLPRPFESTDIIQAQRELLAQCVRTGDRFAILDAPSGLDIEEALAWRSTLEAGDGAFSRAGAYYPWVLAPNPVGTPGSLTAVPPSGHVAGVFARGDNEVGVHKPPANALLELAIGLAAPVDERIHGDANVECLNMLRAYPGRGIRVAGARTVHCRPPWRFINVRRLVDMIEEAVAKDLAWAVFEANDESLWLDIDRLVRGFLYEIWQRGMLAGATAEEAYDVRCDATTNPGDQIDLGRVTCLIGLRPPPPAEFVIARVTVAADGPQAGLTGVNRA